jgi:hypothetical protein
MVGIRRNALAIRTCSRPLPASSHTTTTANEPRISTRSNASYRRSRQTHPPTPTTPRWIEPSRRHQRRSDLPTHRRPSCAAERRAAPESARYGSDPLTRITPRYHAWSVMNLAAHDPCPPQRNHPWQGRTCRPALTILGLSTSPGRSRGNVSNLLIEPSSGHLDSLMRK